MTQRVTVLAGVVRKRDHGKIRAPVRELLEEHHGTGHPHIDRDDVGEPAAGRLQRLQRGRRIVALLDAPPGVAEDANELHDTRPARNQQGAAVRRLRHRRGRGGVRHVRPSWRRPRGAPPGRETTHER